MDAAIIFSDILVIPNALKQKIEFRDKGGPRNSSFNLDIFLETKEKEFLTTLKPVYESIKKTRNIKKIPNFWRAIANNPETLERTWNNLKQIMKKGALDPVTKELIYVAVSITNSCEYCIRSHTAAAKKKGASDQMVKEMIDVVGIANQNNKLVESYQVEVDKIYK